MCFIRLFFHIGHTYIEIVDGVTKLVWKSERLGVMFMDHLVFETEFKFITYFLQFSVIGVEIIIYIF